MNILNTARPKVQHVQVGKVGRLTITKVKRHATYFVNHPVWGYYMPFFKSVREAMSAARRIGRRSRQRYAQRRARRATRRAQA